MKFKDLRKEPEGLVQQIQEGTWQIPKTMKELQKLSEMLYVPYPAKTRRKVLQFQKAIPMGDDHMYDVLDDVGMTDERRLQKWDEPVYINVLAGKALEKEGWITGRVTNNDRSYDAKTHGFGPLSELEEMTMLPRKKGNLKPSRKMLKLERVKDGKVDPLSPMGKSKLTGQEVAKYYKDNPRAKAAARDPQVKKAIEIALDLGGNQTMAMKEIEKLKRGLSRNREVMNALKHANESFGEDAVERAKELADLKAKHKREVDQEKKDIERTRQQSSESVELEEKKEKLSPAKKQYYDFNIMRTKLYRFVKAKTKAHKFGVDDLMLMTSPKVIEGMYKQNPKGFTRMLDKMYPNEKEKMTKMDFTVLGDFIDPRGKVIKGQGDKVEESTSLNEETMLYRVKDIQKPELDKFKSSARLMKLKINIKQSPRGKETLIRLQGNKKQINDFDAVVRGKSSYGDPSKAEAVSPAQQAAIAIAKKKSGKYDKDGKKLDEVLEQLNFLEEQIDLIEQSLLNEESATMKKVRQVIKKKGMMNVDGMKLDLTTASMIASVYDKVNPQNKKRMDSLKLPQLVNLTMKVAGKSRKESVELQEMRPNKDQMPTIGWDAGKQMYRVTMLDKRTGKKVKTSHFPPNRDFPAPKDKSKINAKELGKAIKSLEKKMGMKIGVDEDMTSTSSVAMPEIPLGRKHKVMKRKDLEEQSIAGYNLKRLDTVKPGAYKPVDKKHVGDKILDPKMGIFTVNFDGGTPGIEKTDMTKVFKLAKKYKLDVLKPLPARRRSENEFVFQQIDVGNGMEKFRKDVMRISGSRIGVKEGYGGGPKLSKAQIDKMKKVNYTPVDECSDEEDFKPHMMYDPKTGKGVMAKTYDDHVALGKKGYTHDKPKIKENRAKRDAMRDMDSPKDKDDDDIVATDDDRKAADKNVIMQIRRVADLPKGGQIELPSGKKVKMDRKSAIALNKKFDSIRKPQDKLKLQKMMNDKKISVIALKRLLGK